MIIDNFFTDGQSYSGSRKDIFSMKALKDLEYPVAVIIIKSNSVVFHLDLMIGPGFI